MNEIEQLRKDMDRLIARSWAQESLLLFFGQRLGAENWGFAIEADHYSQQIRDQLRHSTLTDSQIAHFDLEMRALLERLQLLGEKPNPEI